MNFTAYRTFMICKCDNHIISLNDLITCIDEDQTPIFRLYKVKQYPVTCKIICLKLSDVNINHKLVDLEFTGLKTYINCQMDSETLYVLYLLRQMKQLIVKTEMTTNLYIY